MKIRELVFLVAFGTGLTVGSYAGASSDPGGPASEIGGELWESAVSRRAESFTMAPEQLLYEQLQIEKDGSVSHRETGTMGLSYNEEGTASVSIIWATRDGEEFTAQRTRRLERQSSRRNEFLTLLTPFDPDIQDKLELWPPIQTYENGEPLWQYNFKLPLNENSSLVGTARVNGEGSPYDIHYTMAPLPWFLDSIEMHLVFNSGSGLLLFEKLDFMYQASFLFWFWKGGGNASFAEWKNISTPPRLN